MISLSASPACGPRFLAGWASWLSSRASQCGPKAWQKSSNWQKSSTSRSNIDVSAHLMAPTQKEEFKGDKGLASPQTRNSGFRNLKHGFGLKDAWQQSRQALMRWVTVLAVGYAIPQMLAFTDPARLAGLAQPAPWRAPGTRTAGLIQAGIARILREVGRSAFIAAIWGKIS